MSRVMFHGRAISLAKTGKFVKFWWKFWQNWRKLSLFVTNLMKVLREATISRRLTIGNKGGQLRYTRYTRWPQIIWCRILKAGVDDLHQMTFLPWCDLLSLIWGKTRFKSAVFKIFHTRCQEDRPLNKQKIFFTSITQKSGIWCKSKNQPLNCTPDDSVWSGVSGVTELATLVTNS